MRKSGPDEGRQRWWRRHPALALATTLLAGLGGVSVGASLVYCRIETGRWLGTPRPVAVDAGLGLGFVIAGMGLLLGLVWGFLELSEIPAVGRILSRPLVSDRHALGQATTAVIRAILFLERSLRLLIALAIVPLIIWAAFHDRLIAWILGITAALMLGVAWVARRAGWR